MFFVAQASTGVLLAYVRELGMQAVEFIDLW